MPTSVPNPFLIFNQSAYRTLTETVRQQTGLFNAATRGGLVLRGGINQGDFSDLTQFGAVSGVIRDRDVNVEDTIAAKTLAMIMETSVKCAWAAGPFDVTPSWMTWINQQPALAGIALGKQIAAALMQKMLDKAIKALAAATSAQASNVHDYTGTGVNSITQMIVGAGKMGDRASDVLCWVMHSKTAQDILVAAATNTPGLFSFGTINVREDGFGRVFVVTDSAGLTYTSSGAKYRTLGLTASAAVIEENPIDYKEVMEEKAGGENIKTYIQREGTFNLGLKGYKWAKTTGGACPSDAAIATAANWEKSVTDAKDLAAVMILSQ